MVRKEDWLLIYEALDPSDEQSSKQKHVHLVETSR